MERQIVLDDVEQLRLINDAPIRFLLLAEASSNLLLLVVVFFYPSAFLTFLFVPSRQITPLASHLLIWWASFLFVFTGLMLAAVPSKYNTPTLTAGLVHVRRFLYWGLLASELLLALLLSLAKHRTATSIGFAIFLVVIALARLIVLFPKKAWFGTVIIDDAKEKRSWLIFSFSVKSFYHCTSIKYSSISHFFRPWKE